MVARDDTTRSTHRQRAAPSPIRRELAAIGRHPRKRLGQHFLADPQVARRIVDLAGLCATDRVIEIGPGLGALSDLLVERAGEAWLIEVDRDLAQRLRLKYASLPHVHVVEADALVVDFAALLGPGAPAVVVANLPYNIATAVLAALLAQPECFSRMVLMLQREVVERLVAHPGGKIYGALSVLTQFSARVRPVLRVEPGAFVPRPKVESDVVIVEPYRQPPVPVTDPALFRRLVKAAFSQRRKQVANSLRAVCGDAVEILRQVNIDPMRRPETMSLAEFAALANVLASGKTAVSPARLLSGTVDKHEPPLDTAPEKMGPTRGERGKPSEINMEPLAPSSRPLQAAYRGVPARRKSTGPPEEDDGEEMS